ncbi:MAG: YIP1 family protein [Bacillota bacterium]
MEKKKKISFIIILIFIIISLQLSFSIYINAEEIPYDSYIYNWWGEPVKAPQAYLPRETINGEKLGVGKLDNPEDVEVKGDHIYILDSGNNRIIISDKKWQSISVIDNFKKNNKQDNLSNPQGLAVNNRGYIFVADRDNERIVVLDSAGNFVQEITAPSSEESEAISSNFKFEPLKVEVNTLNRIYVIADGVYDGIMEFDADGVFQGFMGAPRVNPNPIDYFWYSIATREQRKRMSIYLPTEFSNIEVNKEGFVYATVIGGEGQNQVIKKFNPGGEDILRRNGFFPPVGDIVTGEGEASYTGASEFIDITTQEYGIYSVLDKNRGRIFTYDRNGNLLYVFGGRGNITGTFRKPVAITAKNFDLLVLDSRSNQITVFKPTDYAQKILSAIKFYDRGNYELAADHWQEIVKENYNFDLAYTGLGRTYFRENNFEQAMKYYKNGHNREGYSKAFTYYRQQVIENNFSVILLLLAAIIGIYIILYKFKFYNFISEFADRKLVKSKQIIKKHKYYSLIKNITSNMKYSLYVMFHPFSGFWDLKHERKSDVLSATALLILVTSTYIIIRQYTGFLFNYWDPAKLNIFKEIINIVLPFFLWCIVNWSLTTLMEGKGTFKDIYIYTCFSFSPLILINIPATIISNYLTLQEEALYGGLLSLGLIWFMMLIFAGTIVTHEFSLLKTILNIIFIIVGIGAVLFIGLLFFSVGDLLYGFFSDIYIEITMRM